MISALVLTLDEEENITRCLSSLSWCDDIVVVDSGSTDRTVAIARSFGARIVERRLWSWSEHLNWICSNIEFRHAWVYYSDADEVVPVELKEEMLRVASDASRREVAFRVRFKNMFLGRWIRRSSLYPTWVLRFFRPGRVRWDREVNPVCIVDGVEGRLQEHFLHFSFNKGFHAWFDKHNHYSSQEASEAARARQRAPRGLGRLMSHDPIARRAALKEVSFSLPCRPTLRFLYMYLVRGGFLDGRAGLIYCRLLASYERMIDLKVSEIDRRQRQLPL